MKTDSRAFVMKALTLILGYPVERSPREVAGHAYEFNGTNGTYDTDTLSGRVRLSWHRGTIRLYGEHGAVFRWCRHKDGSWGRCHLEEIRRGPWFWSKLIARVERGEFSLSPTRTEFV